MTITARFASKCGRCGYGIQQGEQVRWNPGQKAEHLTCPANVQAAPAPARIAVDEAGIYVLQDGTIIKVKANKTKTGTYALRWNITGHGHGEFVYEQGLVRQVAEAGRKMNLDEAKAFALLYGECVRCGRALTDPKSVERALGPVCVKYFRAA